MSASQATDAGAPALPPRSGIRGRRRALAGALADAALGARQRALGIGRALDRAAGDGPGRAVLAIGVYGPGGEAAMAAALARLRETRHRLRVALGALGPPAPALAADTVCRDLVGGKFANLNRIAEAAGPLAADWILLLDDDVELPRRFLDRLLYLAEAFGFDLAQPALSRASHTAWRVTRRRAGLARRTRFVEIGPLTAMARDVYRSLAPFPEQGMGWGLDLHWAALAERHGWRLGVIDAVPVRHRARPPAAAYDRAAARAAARAFLDSHEHLTYEQAERVLAHHRRLP